MAKSARKHEYVYGAAPFDPLKYVKELESVGFTREQAEVQAETFFSIVQEQLVSKYDLKELENELKQNTKELENELKQNMKELENELKQNMKELENELKQNMKELESELKQNIKELDAKTTLELEAIRRDMKETEARTTLEFVAVRHDIKELESKTINQIELLRRDLKIWFGGMLVTLILAFSTIVTLIPHLTAR
jgi:phenylalanyl-tRNA synthetase alpha subunit